MTTVPHTPTTTPNVKGERFPPSGSRRMAANAAIPLLERRYMIPIETAFGGGETVVLNTQGDHHAG